MQNANIQRRANEERQQLQYRSQDLAKSDLPSWPRTCSCCWRVDEWCEKKNLNIVQESLVHALKKNWRNSGEWRKTDHNYHMAIKPADDEHPADTIAQVFQEAKLHDRILHAQPW